MQPSRLLEAVDPGHEIGLASPADSARAQRTLIQLSRCNRGAHEAEIAVWCVNLVRALVGVLQASAGRPLRRLGSVPLRVPPLGLNL